jgi:ribulose-5-phosphate 4-epimerase/fuculose-1-phosphate aldolase
MTAVLNPNTYTDLVARAVRICTASNVMDFNGHVSARDDGDPNIMWINNRLASRSTLTADDIVPYDIAAGKRVGEGVEPPSEHFIHREIYLRRPDVKGIVHAHPEYIVTLSGSGKTLKPISAIGCFIPEAGAPLFDSPVLVNSLKRGEVMAAAIGDAPLVVLRQHGVVVVGDCVEAAVVKLICAEENARQQYHAELLGSPKYLHGEELRLLSGEQLGKHGVRKHWHYHEETARAAGALRGLASEGAAQ